MIVDILEEHLEEAEILAGRRRDALGSDQIDLAGLAKIEERLDAHLDGLAVAEGSWPGDAEALAGNDSERAFAVAATLLRCGAGDRVLAVYDGTKPKAARGMIEALCFCPLSDGGRRVLETWLRGDAARKVVGAAQVLSFHRRLRAGDVEDLARSSDPAVRAAAATAAGRCEVKVPWLAGLLEDQVAEVREAAFLASIRHGDTAAISRLRSLCKGEATCTPRLLWLLAAVGEIGDLSILAAAASHASLAEAAVGALGTLGFPGVVLNLLEWMTQPKLARAAGAAFTRITAIVPPEMSEADETTDSEEASFHDLRPIPDPTAARAEWQRRTGGFDQGLRWRRGRPIQPGDWKREPHHGDLLTRREELMRVWSREPGLFPKLELDAPAARQRAAA